MAFRADSLVREDFRKLVIEFVLDEVEDEVEISTWTALSFVEDLLFLLLSNSVWSC